MLPGPDGGGAQMRYRVAPSTWSKCRPWPIVSMASSGRPGLPVGPTDAVDAVTGAVACGIKPDGLEVLDQDWEDAFFVEKCPGCVTAVAAQS